MIENLSKLYNAHGGITKSIQSLYFWIAFILSIFSYYSVSDGIWVEIALQAFPSLTGFSIASFAVVFAILDPRQIEILSERKGEIRSPLEAVVATFSHVVVIQVFALLFAMITKVYSVSGALDFLSGISFGADIEMVLFFARMSVMCIGHFLTFYGLILVLAAILSLFRLVSSISR